MRSLGDAGCPHVASLAGGVKGRPRLGFCSCVCACGSGRLVLGGGVGGGGCCGRI